MISKIIGAYLLIDGIGSWLIYRKQKIAIMKNRIISLYPLLKLKLKNARKRFKIIEVRQSKTEHLVRFIRAGIGLGLILAPLPF